MSTGGPATPEDRGFLGSTVENGVIRFLSVTGMEKGDPRSEGCPLRWHRRYVGKEREAESEKNKEAKAAGSALHAEIDAYLKGSTSALSPLVLKGIHFVPKPGAGVVSEAKLHTIAGKTITSILDAAGIPLVGSIDCINLRGDTADEDGVPDPPGTIEVIDWKRKGNGKTRGGSSTLLHPNQLITTLQMSGYGEAIRRRFPQATHVRLSHGYFVEKGGKSQKVTKLHVIDECARSWEYAHGLARTLIEIAREPDPGRVPYNAKACDAYGGCPYRSDCRGYQTTSLDNLWNKLAGEIKEPKDMSLLPPNFMASSPAPAAPNDIQAQLAQEEERLRAQQQAQQAQTAPAPTTRETFNVKTAWERIQKHGRGTPTLEGSAAQAIAQAHDQQLAIGAGYAGTGQLGGITLSEPDHIFQFLAELDAQATAAGAPPPPPPVQSGGFLAPDAPSSVPALAAKLPDAAAPAMTTTTAPAGQDAAPVGTTSTNGVVVQPSGQTATSEAPAPKKRGRPRKNPETAPAASAVVAIDTMPSAPAAQPGGTVPIPPSAPPAATTSAPPPAVAQQPVQAVDDGSGTVEVYIDCRPLGVVTQDAAGLIDHLNRELSKRYCVDAQGRPTIQDIRAAPKDSPLAFGGWKGGIREIIAANGIGPGAWHLDTYADELRQIAADALREWCAANGHVYVRAVR